MILKQELALSWKIAGESGFGRMLGVVCGVGYWHPSILRQFLD